MRRTRSDCTVGTFEKRMDFPLVRFGIKMGVIHVVIKK